MSKNLGSSSQPLTPGWHLMHTKHRFIPGKPPLKWFAACRIKLLLMLWPKRTPLFRMTGQLCFLLPVTIINSFSDRMVPSDICKISKPRRAIEKVKEDIPMSFGMTSSSWFPILAHFRPPWVLVEIGRGFPQKNIQIRPDRWKIHIILPHSISSGLTVLPINRKHLLPLPENLWLMITRVFITLSRCLYQNSPLKIPQTRPSLHPWKFNWLMTFETILLPQSGGFLPATLPLLKADSWRLLTRRV